MDETRARMGSVYFELLSTQCETVVKQQPNGVFQKNFLPNKNKEITKIIKKINNKKI